MQVFNMNKMDKKLEGTNPMFVGSVETQRMVTKELSDHLLIGNVVFSPGARTKRHTHESDQVIVVTGGRGILATDEEENEVSLGDVVHVPQGEIHWHGATKDSSFSQISVLIPGENKILD